MKTIKDSVVYNNLVAKFPVDFSKGKKNVQFPVGWNKIKTDLTTPSSKNIAILTGKVNNILTVDIDKPKNEEVDGLKYFEENVMPISELNTLITKSINGGYHIYFEYSTRLFNSIRLKDIQDVSIDIKSDKGCIFEGDGYELICDVQELQPVPEAFIKLYKKEEKRKTFENTYCGNFNDMIIELILNNLSSNYYDNYTNWFNVLCVLKNLDKKKLAIEFSKKSKKFDMITFNNQWDIIEERDSPNFGTLVYFLKQSVNKVKYDNIIRKIKNNELKDEKKNFIELCEYFYELYKDKFVVDKTNKHYYTINEYGIWNEINLESKELLKIIKDFSLIINENGEDEYKLTESSRYNVFLFEALKLFQLDDLQFNKNPFLFPFKNGVYDLKNNVFRKCHKDEFILDTCGYNYKKYNSFNNINLVFEDILPKKEIREYFINVLSLSLENINRFQLIFFLLGEQASNGKSWICELIVRTLGNFGCRFGTNLLTSSREHSSSANSGLMILKDKRFAYCTEPEKGKEININVIKEITGDSITSRELYSTTETFKINATLFVCQNVMSALDYVDEGIIRRLRTISFNTKFVDNPNPLNLNEKKKKIFTTEEFEELKYELINLLIANYIKLQNNSFEFKTPKEITNLSNKYIKNNNNLEEILLDNIEIDNNNNNNNEEFIQLKDIKELLKTNKLKYSNSEIEQTIKRIFNCEFKERYFTSKIDKRNCFIGLKFKTN